MANHIYIAPPASNLGLCDGRWRFWPTRVQRFLNLPIDHFFSSLARECGDKATAVIFSIAFGIAVDDTIHMLARLRQEVADGRPMRSAIRRTLLGTGKAIILTSIILFGGFSVLTTSSFQSSVYMGLLVSFTIMAAVLADLFLLPALLYLWKPDLTPLSRTPARPTDTPEPILPHGSG